MRQKKIFIDSEGDAWFARNISALQIRSEFPDVLFLAPYINAVGDGSVVKFLEIRCGPGHRIIAL